MPAPMLTGPKRSLLKLPTTETAGPMMQDRRLIGIKCYGWQAKLFITDLRTRRQHHQRPTMTENPHVGTDDKHTTLPPNRHRPGP